MAVHFSRDELNRRQRETLHLMRSRGLDGLLIFRQESMYYLTGYDTFGYCFFQCLYFDASGKLSLLTRAPDLRQAQITSTVTDVRVWTDKEGHEPADHLLAMLDSHHCRGKRLGVELNAYGLTAQVWRQISGPLESYATIEDASDLISRLRVIKSPAELEYVTKAAELADDALDEAVRTARPGAYEGDILAAMHGAVYRGGGDDPANEFILGSGENALLCRYCTGRRHLDAQDQLTLEFAGVYRHYHACLMRTIVIGEPDDVQIRMHDACVEAIHACEAALKPGAMAGDVFDAHASVMDANGFKDARMNACGYSLGATYAPTWMDWPMFYTGNPVIIEPDMVYFLHMILFDSTAQRAMTLGHTAVVTNAGLRLLSRHGLDFITVQ